MFYDLQLIWVKFSYVVIKKKKKKKKKSCLSSHIISHFMSKARHKPHVTCPLIYQGLEILSLSLYIYIYIFGKLD